MSDNRTYIAIDLKSFYASVECVERGLDPLTTDLVVADESRTDKTICLAVTPTLKARGISGRARLFEVLQKVRRDQIIIAPPRMAFYIEYSTRIYDIYLKYIAPEDIHVYSIDEVIMDVTAYLQTYKMTGRQLAATMISHILSETGITATAGIGTNMYLCKIAMDIVAKHIPADKNGVRIAELDEQSYRRQLWDHRPLTSFWRVGHGIAKKLSLYGIYTMGQIARISEQNEDFLYDLFGVNAELLIDHAWGWEPVTMDYVKAYRPETNSMSSGQVLTQPYTYHMARNVVMEMADAIALSLVDKRLVADQFVLTVSYDRESLIRPEIARKYTGEIVADHYGRMVPKHARATVNLQEHTSSSQEIIKAVTSLYDKAVNTDLLIRRINISTNNIIPEEDSNHPPVRLPDRPGQAGQAGHRRSHQAVQLDLFTDYQAQEREQETRQAARKKERDIQEALLKIKHRFGKNAILRGTSYSTGATARDRNNQIGGHKA